MSEWPQHFDGKRFFNPGAPQARGLPDVLRWKTTSRAEKSPAFIDDVRASIPPAAIAGSALRLTMINHATVLIQTGGVNIITDPVWSERASPFQWIGPKRHRLPGVRMEDLPRIDIVLLSHNHYDHLDPAALRGLVRRGATQFVAPLGSARLLARHAVANLFEMDWGDRREIAGLAVHAVPAVHFSGRGLFDRNKTLWCGYLIESPAGPVYFAGDTGSGPHFAEIRKRFGPPRLALLPIGAFAPRWFMAPIHMSPEDALEAHRILEARTSIAIHHGTFQMADDGIDAAPKRLAAARAPDAFRVLRNGEWMDVE